MATDPRRSLKQLRQITPQNETKSYTVIVTTNEGEEVYEGCHNVEIVVGILYVYVENRVYGFNKWDRFESEENP